MSEEENKENNNTEEPKLEEVKAEEAKPEEEPKAEEAKSEEKPKAEEPKAEEAKPAEETKADDDTEVEKIEEELAIAEELEAVAAKGEPRKPSKSAKEGPGGGKKKKKKSSKRRSRADAEEQASEFIEKVVQVRRVTKVVKGGKKLSFRTVVIIGNEKGKVGVGVGKASEVLIAIKKSIADARKKLIDIPTVGNTISHSVYGLAGGSKVLLRPAADGTGIIAGGTARIVLELAGVGDILAKSQGSKSPLNVARATVNALQQLRSFQEVAAIRGKTVKEILFA